MQYSRARTQNGPDSLKIAVQISKFDLRKKSALRAEMYIRGYMRQPELTCFFSVIVAE